MSFSVRSFSGLKKFMRILPPPKQPVRNFSHFPFAPFMAFRTTQFLSPRQITTQSPPSREVFLPLFFAALASTTLIPSAHAKNKELSLLELEELSQKLGGGPHHDLSSACLDEAYKKCQNKEWSTIQDLSPLLLRLTDTNGDTLITRAIKNSDSNLVQSLIERGIGIKEKDSQGNTPFHLAVQERSVAVLKTLLIASKQNQLSFDLSTRNALGETPIHLAITQGDDALLDLLLENIDLTKQLKDGGSLLHYAIACGQFQMIDYLLTQHWHKISPFLEFKNPQGLTPLALAAFLGESQSLYLLAKAGAHIEAQDLEGNTPLHRACLGRQKETIDTLFYLSADAKAYNKDFKTPRDLATQELQTHLDELTFKKRQPVNPSQVVIKNLVFQGGGSKGLAYIPIIHHLDQNHILSGVERVAGTSAGAITAALLAVGYSSEEVQHLMDTQKPSDFLDFEEGYTPHIQKQVDQAIVYLRDRTAGGWLANKAFQAWKMSQKGGTCPGDAFRTWMEDKIAAKTGIDNCTFGELRSLMKQPGSRFKHLHVFGTKLGDSPASVEINSLDDEWKDVIISDAIRLSMSIPDVYQPVPIYRKNSQGKRETWIEKGFYIDGGVLNNFPIHTFDFKRYKSSRQALENPSEMWHNPYTLVISLYTPTEPETHPTQPGLFKVTSQLPGLYMNMEMINKGHEEKSMERVVQINNQNISLFTFEIPADRKQALLQDAEAQITAFFKNYALTRLALSDRPYNYALFKQKEAQGLLYLKPVSSHFSGREHELDRLEKELVGHDYSQNVAQVALIADRGYGKSELAAAFALLHLEKFSLIWTLDFRNPEALETSYQRLAKALKIPSISKLSLEELEQVVKEALEEQQKPWLLILDNVDQETVPLHPTKGGAIIFTSTSAAAFKNRGPMVVQGLTRGDLVIQKITEKEDPENQLLAQDLREIPLLLHQAASYISASRISAGDYRRLLAQNASKPLSELSYKELLQATWKVASQGLQTFHSDAYEWLIVASFLDARCVPQSWLEAFLANKYQDVALKNHMISGQILEFLRDYGLISFYKYDRTFSTHGFFQQIIRPPYEPPVELVSFLLSLDEIKNYNATNPESIKAFRQASEHVMSVLSQIKTRSIEASRLGLSLVRYLIQTTQNLDKAEHYLKRTQELTPEKHPAQGRVEFYDGQLLQARAGKANGDQKQGFYLQALEHYENMFKIFETCEKECLPKDFEKIEQDPSKCNPEYQKAIAVAYQGQVLIALGRYSDARHKLNESLERFKKLYPTGEHFDIARIERDLGEILRLEKKYPEAIEKFEKSLKLQRKVYGGQWSLKTSVAVTLGYLGDVYGDLNTQESLEKADQYYEEAIQVNTRAYLTANKSYNLEFYNKRVEIAKRLGQAEKEKEMRSKVEAIREALKEIE